MDAPLLFLIDSMLDERERGGPAGVVLAREPLDVDAMRRVARELGRPETAFVHPADKTWRLRWFTPVDEVNLCGYATLAAAHALWESEWAPEGEVAFDTRAGPLRAARDGAAIGIDLPVLEPMPSDEPLLARALDARPVATWRTTEDVIALFEREEDVANLRPHVAALKAWHPLGVAATAPTDEGYVLRYFAPSWGIPEDDATGSVQGPLARVHAERAARTEFEVRQLSPRGARMRVRLEGARVRVSGRAATRLRATLAL